MKIRLREKKKTCFQRSFQFLNGPLLSLRYFMVTESPLKTMKNGFYSMLKALFVCEIFRFLSLTFSLYRKNGLIRKLRLIRKFMTSFSEAANQKHLIISAMNYSLQNVMHMELVYRIWANSWLLIKQKTKNKDWR